MTDESAAIARLRRDMDEQPDAPRWIDDPVMVPRHDLRLVLHALERAQERIEELEGVMRRWGSQPRTRIVYNPDLREDLAMLEHEQWAAWTQYMLDALIPLLPVDIDADAREVSQLGKPMLPQTHARLRYQGWRRQILTHYNQLSESEKDSDREWADKVITLIAAALRDAAEAVRLIADDAGVSIGPIERVRVKTRAEQGVTIQFVELREVAA